MSLRHLLRALVLLAAPAPAAAQASVLCDCDDPAVAPCANGFPSALFGGCMNSTGLKGVLMWSTSTGFSVSADEFVLSGFNLPPSVPSLLFHGGARHRAPFGDGELCVGPGSVGMHRFVAAGTNLSGEVDFGPGLSALSQASLPAAGQLLAGRTFVFQLWYRDLIGPCASGFNLSNALAFTLGP